MISRLQRISILAYMLWVQYPWVALILWLQFFKPMVFPSLSSCSIKRFLMTRLNVQFPCMQCWLRSFLTTYCSWLTKIQKCLELLSRKWSIAGSYHRFFCWWSGFQTLCVDMHTSGCAILLNLALEMDHGTMVVIIDGSKKLIGRSKAHFVDDERIQEWAEVLLEIIKNVEDPDRCHQCYTTSDELMECGQCRRVLYCCKQCEKPTISCTRSFVSR